MKAACALACGLLFSAAQLFAHHSFAAEYDGTKPVTVTGAVAKVDWTNPHIHFYVDVKSETHDNSVEVRGVPAEHAHQAGLEEGNPENWRNDYGIRLARA